MQRRSFLIGTGSALALTAVPLSSLLVACAPSRTLDVTDFTLGGGLPREAWQTLAAVQAHLLPSEPGAPGASDVNALTYLATVLAQPDIDADYRSFILIKGISELERHARAVGGRHFIELTELQREQALRYFEATAEGQRWLEELLGYVLEALLGDPVYGGNPDGAGWRWLAHTPGFPRPPVNKRYYLL